MTRCSILLVLALGLFLACDNPKKTVIPQDVSAIETIKPSIDKLKPDERELVAAYVMRKTVAVSLGGLFGQNSEGGIPQGMTIGQAIEEQKKFQDDAALEEKRQQELKAKIKAEREIQMAAMRKVITVTLISKKPIVNRGFSGIIMDESLQITFGYKNNSEKDVSGVKGTVRVFDQFGDQLSVFGFSNDKTIKAGQSVTWTGSRSYKYAVSNNKDKKLATLEEEKYKVVWEPKMIVFADGEKITAPNEE